MKNKRIAFIGCGNMGSSLMGGLLADGYDKTLITGAEPDPARRSMVTQQYDIEMFADAESAIAGANIVVLAIKPQIMADVCEKIRSALQQDVLIISLAAGIELESLAQWLGKQHAIIRVMSNTPALIGAGASALVANEKAGTAKRNQAETIMRSVGITMWLKDEALINAVTAVSGSGPAYFFLIMEVIQKAAVSLGLDKEQARLLTLQTALGAARMALESESDIEQLRHQVTSPGGTTEQALSVLTGAGLEQIFADALKAARDRSAELSEVYGNKNKT